MYPTSRCKLRLLRMQRIHDHLLLEEEYVENQERLRKQKVAKDNQGPAASDLETADRNADERGRVDDMRGSPMGVGTLEEMIDDALPIGSYDSAASGEAANPVSQTRRQSLCTATAQQLRM